MLLQIYGLVNLIWETEPMLSFNASFKKSIDYLFLGKKHMYKVHYGYNKLGTQNKYVC